MSCPSPEDGWHNAKCVDRHFLCNTCRCRRTLNRLLKRTAGTIGSTDLMGTPRTRSTPLMHWGTSGPAHRAYGHLQGHPTGPSHIELRSCSDAAASPARWFRKKPFAGPCRLYPPEPLTSFSQNRYPESGGVCIRPDSGLRHRLYAPLAEVRHGTYTNAIDTNRFCSINLRCHLLRS